MTSGPQLTSMLPKTGKHAAWQPHDPENHSKNEQAAGEFGGAVTGLMGETINKNPNPAEVERIDEYGNPIRENIGDGTVFGQLRGRLANAGTGVAPAGSNVDLTIGSGE